jgi:hypothetical protein
MQYPLAVVFENGNRLANRLRVDGIHQRCTIREVRSPAEFRAAIPPGSAAIAVVELDDTKAGWEALVWLREHRTTVAAVAATAGEMEYHSSFAWDLGVKQLLSAACALRELAIVVESLLSERWGKANDAEVAGRR